MTEYEKMIQGALFKPNEVAKEYEDNSLYKCQQYNLLPANEEELKKKAIKGIIGKSKEDICVVQPFQCAYGKHIEVGNRFFANIGCVVLAEGGVKFGDDVLIAPNCIFSSVEHPTDPTLRKEGYDFAKQINVGNNVWFGAGSVVTKDIPANVVAVGNPCRVIKSV